MRRYFNRLSLTGIIGIILFVCSCSKEEINPLQGYFGVYDCYVGGIPGEDDNGNFPIGNWGRLVIREAANSKVNLEIYEPGLTYPDEKITKLSNYQIVPIDTTGDKYQPFARIVNPQNNMEIGKIRFWYYGIKGSKERFERLYIPMDFMIEPNRRIAFYAMKRKD